MHPHDPNDVRPFDGHPDDAHFTGESNSTPGFNLNRDTVDAAVSGVLSAASSLQTKLDALPPSMQAHAEREGLKAAIAELARVTARDVVPAPVVPSVPRIVR